MQFKETNEDVKLVVGDLVETTLNSHKSFDFSYFLSEIIEPFYKYSMNIDNIEIEIDKDFQHHLISYTNDRIVICLLFKLKFELRLMDKKGDLIRIHSFHSPSTFISFCANSTRLFLLAKQDDVQIVYEFDQELLLRRTKEVDISCIKVSCDDNYVYLLIKKLACTVCGYCLEIQSDSIQEIERRSFKFMKLHAPNINDLYNNWPDTELELYSQGENTFVFYINDHTKIEIFSKEKLFTGIIQLRHNVVPSDVYIISSNVDLIQIFYKYNNTWFLVDKSGQVIKRRICDGLKDTDKFCLTNEGTLVVISKELNVQLF
jgi:hypothetical protein